MSSSYPFLALARRRRLDYGRVLCFVDAVGRAEGMGGTLRDVGFTINMQNAFNALSMQDRAAVTEAVQEEENRRRAVIVELLKNNVPLNRM